MKKCKKGIVLIALSVAIACFSAGCVGDGLKDKFEDWFDKSESVEESSDVEDTSSSIPEQSDCVHTYGKEPTLVVEATCTTDGREVYKCTKCGEEKVETLEKLGHNVETHVAQAATCTEIGWAEYQTCTRCDYTTYEEIPALGHTDTDDNGFCDVCLASTNLDNAFAFFQNSENYTEQSVAVGDKVAGSFYRIYKELGSDATLMGANAILFNTDYNGTCFGIGAITGQTIILRFSS